MLYVRGYFVCVNIYLHICVAPFECILFASVCQQELDASNKLARVSPYVSCLSSTYEWMAVGVCPHLQPGWPLWVLQSSRPGRCCCGPQPWSDICCLAWGSGWWPASPLDGSYSQLAPWCGHTQATHHLMTLMPYFTLLYLTLISFAKKCAFRFVRIKLNWHFNILMNCSFHFR